jgi:hypothetical protein
MVMEHLYALTEDEFDVLDMQALHGPRGTWEVTAIRHPTRQPRHKEVTVGWGDTEKEALCDLRVQLSAKKCGEDHG